MEQIVPGLFTFTTLMAGRVYLITEGDGLTLIDASLPSAAKKILAELQAAGHRPAAIKRIIITHAHPDHVGAIPDLQAASGAELIVPAGERAALEGEIPIPRASTFFRLPKNVLKNMKADAVLNNGDVLDKVWGGLQAISTPGHAPGHMAYWQAEKRVLICGDVIFNAPSFRLPYNFLTVDPAENIRSVGKLTALEPDIICFGHGRPMTENSAQQLRDFAKKVGAIQ